MRNNTDEQQHQQQFNRFNPAGLETPIVHSESVHDVSGIQRLYTAQGFDRLQQLKLSQPTARNGEEQKTDVDSSDPVNAFLSKIRSSHLISKYRKDNTDEGTTSTRGRSASPTRSTANAAIGGHTQGRSQSADPRTSSNTADAVRASFSDANKMHLRDLLTSPNSGQQQQQQVDSNR
jgi:hypothetical protein